MGLNAAAVDIDTRRFTRLAAEATPASRAEAAALYRGHLLAGLDLDEPAFNDWLLSRRERLREIALNAMSRLLAHQTESAVADAAIETALRLLALEPLHEPTHRALMQLYARTGRRSAAARQYRLCAEALMRELGVRPEWATEDVYRQVLAVTTATSPDASKRPWRGRL